MDFDFPAYGTKLIRKKTLNGKIDVAYVVSRDDEGYLVKLSRKFPYNYGDDHFFIHIARIWKVWEDLSKGVQLRFIK